LGFFRRFFAFLRNFSLLPTRLFDQKEKYLPLPHQTPTFTQKEELMEKFGIFDLLDALSALSSSASEAPQEKSGESGSPASDVASPHSSATTPPPPAEPAAGKISGEEAYAMLLARQEQISRRIDKQNH